MKNCGFRFTPILPGYPVSGELFTSGFQKSQNEKD